MTQRLKNLSRTRWTTRGSAAVVLIKKTRELQEALEISSKDPTVSPECRAKSGGMLDKIRSVRPMFQVVVMHELANLLENNSRNLQSSFLTAEQAVYGIKKMLVRLQEMRSMDNAKELLRICYEAVDSLVEALQKRFRHEYLETLQAIETCLLKAVNKELSLQEVRPQLKGLSTGISIDTLVEQLAELPVMLKLYNAECVLPIKKVTKLSTLCEIFNHRESTKECLSEVHKVLTFYMSVPISSATAERSFSVMRRIKSWLRSTMSENSLNNKMFATIHKDRIDAVDSERVATVFVASSKQRRRYFGQF